MQNFLQDNEAFDNVTFEIEEGLYFEIVKFYILTF